MNRDKLIAKIKALRSMTSDRGCTEAEALAAAEKAAALMAEHAISADLLEIRDQSTNVNCTFKAARSKMWSYIAHVTNCATLHQTGCRPYRLVFVGREPGPEIACYLREVCDRAIDQAVAEFKAGPIYKGRRATSTRRKAVEDFTAAMVGRLGNRLIDMFRPTISKDDNRRAVEVRDALFPAAREVTQQERKTRFHAAASAGYAAGNKVNLAHGVNDGSKPVGLIGGDA